MWKTCGYIVHIGTFPISAQYLVYNNENENEISWIEDPNEATIFPSIEFVKETFSNYDDKTWKFRIVVMSDMSLSI